MSLTSGLVQGQSAAVSPPAKWCLLVKLHRHIAQQQHCIDKSRVMHERLRFYSHAYCALRVVLANHDACPLAPPPSYPSTSSPQSPASSALPASPPAALTPWARKTMMCALPSPNKPCLATCLLSHCPTSAVPVFLPQP